MPSKKKLSQMRSTFQAEKFKFSLGMHRDNDVIWVAFPNDPALRNHIKEFVKLNWSQSQKCWYCKDTTVYRELFGLEPKSHGQSALLKIHPVNRPAFERFVETLALKMYSSSTVQTYSVEFGQLLKLLKDYPVNELTPDRLRSYFLYCTKKLRLSENQLHSRMNALKFYFEQVLHQPKMFFDIPRPKRPMLLPKSLERREIEKMITITTNPKHRLILKLCYGMGLRVSEVVKLKISDINSESMLARIEGSKGKKDRYVNLPKSVLEEMRTYYKEYRPAYYLFEGQYGGAYNLRSAQAVFKEAMRKAGIHKQVGIHSLRHSYATHLLEYGTDVTFIQKLLGHQDVKTTMTYLKITNPQLQNIQSPLDKL